VFGLILHGLDSVGLKLPSSGSGAILVVKIGVDRDDHIVWWGARNLSDREHEHISASPAKFDVGDRQRLSNVSLISYRLIQFGRVRW